MRPVQADHHGAPAVSDRSLVRAFFRCGDSDIIEFAMLRARLNRKEQDVIRLLLDDCLTQEEAAEVLDISPRHLQNLWYSACDKLLRIPWVVAYAKEIQLKDA